VNANTPDLNNSGVPDGAVKILTGFYQDAAQRLAKIVLNPPGGTQASKDFRMARASSLVHKIDAITRALDADASKWIGTHVPAAVAQGVAMGTAQAKAVGVRPDNTPIAGSLAMIDRRTVERFALDTYADLHRAADSMGNYSKTVLHHTAQLGLGESDINAILAGGAIDGEPTQTIRRLREALRAVHGEKVQVMSKNGSPIEFDVGYYASMVARTKTREATVSARHDRLSSLGLDLVAIIGRVSKSFCTAFLGQVFSLSGKSDKYPAYSSLPGGGPPFHPNCSKSTRPFVAELASDAQLDRAGGVDGADKLLGMDQSQAQRAFQDLQLHTQVKAAYATTSKQLTGSAA
jgi:hypothetical protein